MPVSPELKQKALASSDFRRQFSILRQVVYKELQSWKRQAHDVITSKEVPQLIILTDDEKALIDSQVAWLMAKDSEVRDDIVEAYLSNN